MTLTVVAIVLAMVVIVALAGLVVVYVAYPHRGGEVPHAPWLGRVMRRGVARLPTLQNTNDRTPPDTHNPEVDARR